MRASVVVLLSLLLCSVALAACGSDSGSDSTTATVPTGKLGAQGGEHCATPSLPGVNVTQFDVAFLDCSGAANLAAQVISDGKVPGYRCSITPSGNGGEATCVLANNSTKSFFVAWRK